ncbi:MAG: carboxylating nicotinate-nucleotide diphosphorylase [Bdellovibrionales bacterium]|nr:carboxylating nicotinate-nucleotide diphosphorylase [Bdellovibrionales bacterium]
MVWNAEIEDLVRRTLVEDCVHEDVTTQAVLAGTAPSVRAVVRTREPGVFSGEAILSAFTAVADLSCEPLVVDGAKVEAGQELLRLFGEASACLALERSLLNLLALASGIATKTRAFVEAAAPYPTQILATRKTLPGLRALQLSAVKHGGGRVHRRDLSDGILIKDNHLLICDLEQALLRAKSVRSPLHRVEIEVDTLAQLQLALELKPDIVMLDNFCDGDRRTAVDLAKGKVLIEVSGGVQLKDVPALAALGVDFISVGALTHTVTGLDLTMEILQS